MNDYIKDIVIALGCKDDDVVLSTDNEKSRFEI